MLIAEDANSCLDSLTEVIMPTESPSPASQEYDICIGGSVTISPENGQVFYFYSDSTLKVLQHKGSSIKLDQVLADTSIYITNIDSLQESLAAEIKINVNELEAKFSAVYILEGGSAAITNESTGATSYVWVIEGDTVSTEPVPNIKVNETGDYKLELYITNDNGCQDSVSHIVRLEIVNSINDDIASHINLYPNPTTGRVNISNRGDAEIEVLTTSGQLLIKVPVNENHINLEDFPDGTYLIKVQTKGSTFYRKVVKR